MAELEDVNDVAATAAYLKITPNQVKRLVSTGRLGVTKGKGTRTPTFTRESIRAYLEANTTQPTAAPHPSGLTQQSLRRVQAGRI